MKKSGKTFARKSQKRAIKKHGSGRQKMATLVAFNVFKIVVDREGINRREVPHARGARN